MFLNSAKEKEYGGKMQEEWEIMQKNPTVKLLLTFLVLDSATLASVRSTSSKIMDWKEKIQNPNELLNPTYKQQTQRDMPVFLPGTLHYSLFWSEEKAQHQQREGLRSLVPYSGARTHLSSVSEHNDFNFITGLLKKKSRLCFVKGEIYI